jgi:hypothetical protein
MERQDEPTHSADASRAESRCLSAPIDAAAGSRGHAYAFHGFVQHVMTLLPAREVIEGGLRSSIVSYPEITVREVIANIPAFRGFSLLP